MSYKTPTFLLRVAKSCVEEVAQETSSLLDSIHSLGKDVDYTKVSHIALGLLNELNTTIRLADKATELDPQIMLPDEETASSVKSKAYFQMGLIAIAQKKYKDAIKNYEESLKYGPDQATYYNIGLCYLRMKGLFTDKTQEAIATLQKCIDMNPESNLAIDAGKILAESFIAILI